MNTEQQAFFEQVKAQIENYDRDWKRYIELANKPYGESTDSENAEMIWLDENLPHTFTAEAARTLLQIINAQQAIVDAAARVRARVEYEVREYYTYHAIDSSTEWRAMCDALDKADTP